MGRGSVEAHHLENFPQLLTLVSLYPALSLSLSLPPSLHPFFTYYPFFTFSRPPFPILRFIFPSWESAVHMPRNEAST